jgi:hypothetical protein
MVGSAASARPVVATFGASGATSWFLSIDARCCDAIEHVTNTYVTLSSIPDDGHISVR